jgi:hypothetical protein
MAVVMIGLINSSGQPIAIGNPVALVGTVLMPVGPDPVPAGAAAAGMVDSPQGSTEIEVNYQPQIAVAPTPVTLTIDIWIQGTTFQKFYVASSDPVNFPIQGVYSQQGGPDAWAAIVTVG